MFIEKSDFDPECPELCSHRCGKANVGPEILMCKRINLTDKGEYRLVIENRFSQLAVAALGSSVERSLSDNKTIFVRLATGLSPELVNVCLWTLHHAKRPELVRGDDSRDITALE
jgi:hypothetical protein